MIDWEEAIKHLDFVEKCYLDCGRAGIPAVLLFMNPLRKRFNSGERTEQLYKEIMELE